MDNAIRRITKDEKLILFRDFSAAYGVNSILQFGIHRDKVTKPKGRPGVPEHAHRNAVEINFQVEGRQRYFIGEREYFFKPGTVYICAPGIEHGSRGYAKERGLTYYLVIDVRPKAFLNFDARTGTRLRSLLMGIGTGVFAGSAELKRYFERLTAECEERHEHAAFAIRSIVTDIILETERCSRCDAAPTISPAITAALRTMERSDGTIALAPLAAGCGLSYSRFIHRFKGEVGESPKAFMIRRRIERAKERLSSTDDAITDIAYASGFRSINLFIGQFKKITGMTPREYRKALHR